MNDDAALLRRYAETGSNSAFTELVRRYIDLVYRAALRRTDGDTHRAEDIAQHVFAALARDARKLARHTVLAGWLHTATRNAALNLVMSEKRRQARELAARALAPAAADAPLEWDRIRSVLDAAIDELSESDRTVVVLRYLEQRPFAEIGATLGLSEDAARVRTSRALDKLRDLLAHRGITSTAAAVGALVSSQPLVSAPAGLAVTLAARALGSLGGAAAVVGSTSLMSLKFLTAASLTAVVAFGAGAYLGLSRDADLPSPPAVDTTRTAALVAALRDENLALRTQVAQLTERVTALANAPKPPPPPAPGKSRGEQQQVILNNLRQIAAARDQFILEEKRAPISVGEIVGYTRYVKRLLPIDGEDYRGLSMDSTQPMTVTTAGGITVTYDPAGGTTTKPELTPEIMHAKGLQYRIDQADAKVTALEKKIVPHAMRAENAYRAVNGGRYAPNPEDLLPYFSTVQAGADWVEFIEATKAAAAAREAK